MKHYKVQYLKLFQLKYPLRPSIVYVPGHIHCIQFSKPHEHERNSFSQLGVASVATNHRLTQVKLEFERSDLIDTNRGY